MSKRNRVVVTGLGVLAPNGIGLAAFWDSLVQGRSGIGPITHFDTTNHECRIAGEVKGFEPLVYIDASAKPKRMARHTQLALAATQMALRDAHLKLNGNRRHLPISLGVSSSAFDMIESGMERLVASGARRVSPWVVNSSPPQAVASALSASLGVPTRCITLSTACAAGLDAIANGAQMIQAGHTDQVLAGGTDAPITSLAFATFASAGLVSRHNDHPEKASRPFDRDRDSGVISEGAAIVVLENLDSALARGAPIYLEIVSYATNTDSVAAPPGSGLEETMRMALANAALRIDHIDYICAHGPGHPVLDRVETAMIKNVFGRHAYMIPISSIKGVTGNPLAAGGPMQVVSCALAVRHGMIPPTANLEAPDEECDLDYVPLRARHARMRRMLINAHGIGGSNSSLVVESPSVG